MVDVTYPITFLYVPTVVHKTRIIIQDSIIPLIFLTVTATIKSLSTLFFPVAGYSDIIFDFLDLEGTRG